MLGWASTRGAKFPASVKEDALFTALFSPSWQCSRISSKTGVPPPPFINQFGSVFTLTFTSGVGESKRREKKRSMASLRGLAAAASVMLAWHHGAAQAQSSPEIGADAVNSTATLQLQPVLAVTKIPIAIATYFPQVTDINICGVIVHIPSPTSYSTVFTITTTCTSTTSTT